MMYFRLTLIACLVLAASCSHKSAKNPEKSPAVQQASSAAEPGKCFAIGRTAMDQACYSFKTKTQCLETSTKYSCGWEAQQ